MILMQFLLLVGVDPVCNAERAGKCAGSFSLILFSLSVIKLTNENMLSLPSRGLCSSRNS